MQTVIPPRRAYTCPWGRHGKASAASERASPIHCLQRSKRHTGGAWARSLCNPHAQQRKQECNGSRGCSGSLSYKLYIKKMKMQAAAAVSLGFQLFVLQGTIPRGAPLGNAKFRQLYAMKALPNSGETAAAEAIAFRSSGAGTEIIGCAGRRGEPECSWSYPYFDVFIGVNRLSAEPVF